MKYKNGKEYKFKFGNVTVYATFENLTEEVCERFQQLCVNEKLKALREKGELP